MLHSKLNITFHNPNTEEETVKALVKIIASSLVEQAVSQKIHKTIISDKVKSQKLDVMN
ncbi:hypothetical protein SAMN05192585_12312 [Acetanaerobacterium elongatum]|uniref:Uncharacterized protein n=1 Tax=Acetanaerobacterium elongatum TaxID=258515 RepID=A0A1H0CF95_9FIRM|nr:hypothetical protein SAMN05192585_12312 [Acetanaerobacterium elongatum]